jgi:NAD(P)-dependent dehydrogenase (short-subunit alcohol dehydrogenase family)
MRQAPGPGDVPPIEDWNRLLEGRVAVVTGGGSGIGAAISELFASHGASVHMADVDRASTEEVVERIEREGGRATGHGVDVRKPDQVAALAERVLADDDGVDVLVNNVGDFRPMVPFRSSSADSWSEMYRVNLEHVFGVTKAFLQPMIDGGGGTIVVVHSVEAMRGFPPDPVYGAMKAAAAKFTTDLAVSVGRHGIRVNGIGPDLTQTPQVDYLTGYEEQQDLWASWAPVGRPGWPEEQARVALFLASDQSSFVTGHNIPVDGGTLAGGRWFYSPKERRFVNRSRNL